MLLTAAWVLAYSDYVPFGPWLGGLLFAAGIFSTLRLGWVAVRYFFFGVAPTVLARLKGTWLRLLHRSHAREPIE